MIPPGPRIYANLNAFFGITGALAPTAGMSHMRVRGRCNDGIVRPSAHRRTFELSLASNFALNRFAPA